MAFTVSNIVNTDTGNLRFNIYRVTADATTGTVSTGLNVILHASLTHEAVASNSTAPLIAINKNASGVAANGTIGLSACVASDIYHILCWSPA